MADFLNVNEVLSNIDLKEDMTVAEFGCGSGHFIIALAKKLREGKVYAMDVQEEMLSALKGKIASEKIGNVSTILCNLESPNGSTLPDSCLDAVLIPNVLFQADDKYAIIKEGHRILKKGGELVIIDWLKPVPFGPEILVKPEEVKEIAQGLGLALKKEFAAGDYHYGLLFVK